MQSTWFLFLGFLLVFSPMASGYIGIGVGVGVGVGGVGVWINGGGITPQTPPSDPSDPSLRNEYTALQAWKSAITEDPSGILTNWVGPDVCSYRGVFCSDAPGDMASSSSNVVAGIDLNHASLKGSLVRELSLLSHLSILHLNSNKFSASVPDTFRELQFLTELDLSNNLFSGPFPTTTLFIPSLIYLDLRFNNFSGEVPDEVFEKELDAIFLNNNNFEGQIPMSLWNSPASVISLANNRLTGNIPTSFGYMGGGIKEILFLNNKLTGCIPEGVGFLTEMKVLDLSFNSFTGHLPDTISCLSGIEVLNIGHNQLSGVLPDLVCALKSLANLTVSYNFFSGFSDECTRLFFRNVGFDFSGNCIPGRDMQRPQPECMGVPGGGLNCLRIPSVKQVACSSNPMDQRAGFRGWAFSLHSETGVLPSSPLP